MTGMHWSGQAVCELAAEVLHFGPAVVFLKAEADAQNVLVAVGLSRGKGPCGETAESSRLEAVQAWVGARQVS